MRSSSSRLPRSRAQRYANTARSIFGKIFIDKCNIVYYTILQKGGENMIRTIRLNEDEEQKLEWLLKTLNEEPKGYKDLTISDIIKGGLHNEWCTYNLEYWETGQKEKCDPYWKKRKEEKFK